MRIHAESVPSGTRRSQAMVALFLVSAGTLTFEVALTRVCSVLLQYHVSFAVVSLAVLGVGLGGFVAYLVTRHGEDRLPRAASLAFLALSPGMLLACVTLLRLPFAAYWTFLLFLVLPPFVAAGALISLLLRALAPQAGALYAADLVGGAFGAFLAVLALDHLGGPVNTILLLSLVMALVAPWWVGGKGRLRLVALGLAVIAFTAVVAQGRTNFFALSYARAPHKLITSMLQRTPMGAPRLLPELQRWDATSRVDVVELRSTGGVQRLVFIDGETPTAMLAPEALSPGEAPLDIAESLPALPYRLLEPRRVLSIGTGGGYDVVLARRFAVEDMDAVELNGGVLQVVEAARDFTGDVYGAPGVRVHHAEGRLFVEAAAPESYDLISLVLAQSLAGNLREYALSENYLYTQEAFESYLRALRPGGAVALSVKDESLQRRLLRTAFEVLEAGGREGADCLVALASPGESPYDRLLLVRERPFDADTAAGLKEEVRSRGYVPLHLPLDATFTESLALSRGVALRPATDDRPFVFHLGTGIPPALRNLLLTAILLLLAAWAGLAWAAGPSKRRQAWALSVYFVCLGLGFLMVEVLVLQKSILIIGYPTLNLAVVLAAFLVAAGVGSAASARLGPRALQRLRAGLWLLAPTFFLLMIGLDGIHAHGAGWSLAARCLAVALLVFPFAFVMGMPFPLGVRSIPNGLVPLVPWYWGVNGVASILGSALVVALVLEVGFQMATFLPAAAYVVAGVVITRFEA